MATANQLAANRANALHSTGPTTPAGKAVSSKNATSHALTSKYLIILPGLEDAFVDLESGLRSKLKPAGPLEEVIYKRAVECAWNLERCRMSELDIMESIARNTTVDPMVNQMYHDRFDRIHRYARESENSMYKAMRELGKLQAESQFRDEVCPLTVDQKADPVFVAQTPHNLSQVCFLSQIMKHVIAFRKSSGTNHQQELAALATQFESRFEANFEPDAAAEQQSHRAAAA